LNLEEIPTIPEMLFDHASMLGKEVNMGVGELIFLQFVFMTIGAVIAKYLLTEQEGGGRP